MLKKSLIMLQKCTQYIAHYAQVEPTIMLIKSDMRREETQLHYHRGSHFNFTCVWIRKWVPVVSYPAPKSPRGEGSGDIGTISWLYKRVISCQYYAINHVQVPRCYAMQCTIKELCSHWLALNRQLTLRDRCCATRCKVTWKSWSCNLIGFRKSKNAELARTKKGLKCHQTLFLLLGGGVWGRD